MSKWVLQKAVEFCASVRDGTHDSPKSVERGGKPLVTSKVVKQGVVRVEDAYLISEKDYRKINERSKVDRWDVLMTMIGTVGECAIVKDDPDYAIKNIALFKMAGDEEKSKWLYYYLTSPTGQGALRGNFRGSSQQYISLDQLRNLEVPVPEKDVRSRIVAILSDYDSAIDNARRQIALLEEAAMRLYREWFDGTGKGWKRTPVVLADVLERLGTGLNPRKNFTLGHGENFYVTIKNMANNRVYLDSKCDKVDDEAIRKINRRSDLRKGDVLFSGIGTIGRAYLIAEAPKNWNTSESVFNLRANSRITPEFLYMLMLSSKMQQYAMNNATGCAQKGIRAAALRAYQFDLAPLIEIEKFTEQVRPMLNAVNDLNKKIDSLTEARDRLLPKLMSGEIEV